MYCSTSVWRMRDRPKTCMRDCCYSIADAAYPNRYEIDKGMMAERYDDCPPTEVLKMKSMKERTKGQATVESDDNHII